MCWTVEIYDISHQSGGTASGSDFRHSSNVYDIGIFFPSSLGVSVLYWTRKSMEILNSTSIYVCTATEFSKLHILFSFTFRYFPLLLFHFLLRFIFFIFFFSSFKKLPHFLALSSYFVHTCWLRINACSILFQLCSCFSLLCLAHIFLWVPCSFE